MSNIVLFNSKPHLKLKAEYESLVKDNRIPLLVTYEETFNISPKAVRELYFYSTYISFLASFNGIVVPVKIKLDDIIELIAEDSYV